MSTTADNAGVGEEAIDDLHRMMKHLADGTPVGSELRRRVEGRADRVTERLRRENRQIDVEKVLQDVREES